MLYNYLVQFDYIKIHYRKDCWIMKKNFSTIVKLGFVAAALLVTTTPEISPLWWFVGY